MLKITFLFALLIAYVFADVADFTKSANRSFNEIEGKVPKLSVEMDPAEYERLLKIAQIDQENDIVIGCNLDASCLEDFETKVTLTYEVDGEKQVFKKVTFKTGGNFGRANDRVGFNFKLKGDDLLLDRKQIRVRPDASDVTHMRSKIAYDLINNWGLPSLQEAYCEFYLNDEYFGLYFLQDALKGNWIRKTYGLPADEEVETLFYCRKDGVNLVKGDECFNQNDEAANYTQPFEEFLEQIENSKSIEDLEKFMNVDLFMKNLAIEFLYGSFDHFIIQGHNFYVYQRKDGIWDMILVDFDSEFGNGLFVFTSFILQYNTPPFGYTLKFEDMPKPGKKILDVTYFNDNTYFKQALRDLMITGFNPDNLFKRVDELKEFIAPYVKKSTTLREDGRLPGVINFKGTDTTHTYEDFEKGTEFEPLNPITPSLKAWIQNRFEFACEEYGFDPEEILMEAAEFRGEEYVPKTPATTEAVEPTETESVEVETETTTESVETEAVEPTETEEVEDETETTTESVETEAVEPTETEDIEPTETEDVEPTTLTIVYTSTIIYEEVETVSVDDEETASTEEEVTSDLSNAEESDNEEVEITGALEDAEESDVDEEEENDEVPVADDAEEETTETAADEAEKSAAEEDNEDPVADDAEEEETTETAADEAEESAAEEENDAPVADDAEEATETAEKSDAEEEEAPVADDAEEENTEAPVTPLEDEVDSAAEEDNEAPVADDAEEEEATEAPAVEAEESAAEGDDAPVADDAEEENTEAPVNPLEDEVDSAAEEDNEAPVADDAEEDDVEVPLADDEDSAAEEENEAPANDAEESVPEDFVPEIKKGPAYIKETEPVKPKKCVVRN